MDYCCGYKRTVACRKRFSCKLFSYFFVKARAGEFKDKEDVFSHPAPFTEDSKKEFVCKFYIEK